MHEIFRYVDRNRERFLGELFTLLRQPSISAQNVGVAECATLLKSQLEAIGIAAQVLPTTGHPVVFGEVKAPGAKRTILIYGHYDVQPPDPLELWHTPPFEPTIKDGRIWGRGTGDNKGQFFAHLKAVEAILKTAGRLPVNVKFLLEGEEEISSRSLRAFIEANRALLAADYCFCSDGPMLPNHQPTILFGVRGILHVEVSLKGANRDVHSGNLGVFVPAPAWRLVHFLNTLKDPQGRILIQGFADAVVPPTPLEAGDAPQDPIRSGRPDRAGAARRTGGRGAGLLGATDVPAHCEHLRPDERLSGSRLQDHRPAPGVGQDRHAPGGESGPGRHLREVRRARQGARFRRPAHRAPGRILSVPDEPGSSPRAARRSGRSGRDSAKEPVLQPCMGGSDPDYYFTRVLGIPRVNVPYAPHDENNHAPNESIMVEGFFSGIKTTAALLHEVAAL